LTNLDRFLAHVTRDSTAEFLEVIGNLAPSQLEAAFDALKGASAMSKYYAEAEYGSEFLEDRILQSLAEEWRNTQERCFREFTR